MCSYQTSRPSHPTPPFAQIFQPTPSPSCKVIRSSRVDTRGAGNCLIARKIVARALASLYTHIYLREHYTRCHNLRDARGYKDTHTHILYARLSSPRNNETSLFDRRAARRETKVSLESGDAERQINMNELEIGRRGEFRMRLVECSYSEGVISNFFAQFLQSPRRV